MNPRVYDPREPQGGAADAAAACPLDYSSVLLTAPELNAKPIPERPLLLGKWMREGDIGFIFASRGVGKTWLAMLIGNALAENRELGEWCIGELPCPVLYVDGEMNLADSQARSRSIGIGSPSFRWLHHQQLFDAKEEVLNIADARCQQAISALLGAGEVLILDNLSSLCRAIAENDNDAWEAVLHWLLSLRRRKVTVILVHHAGCNGEMRGASRREDATDWILRLRDDTLDDNDREKAIVTNFTKCRCSSPKDAMPLRWTFQLGGASLTYSCKPHSGPDALAELIMSGVSKNSECAELLGASKGAVSKWAKVLESDDRITISRGGYFPIKPTAI